MSELWQRYGKMVPMMVAGFFVVGYASWESGEKQKRKNAQIRFSVERCETMLRENHRKAQDCRAKLARMTEEIGKESDPQVQKEKREMVETFSAWADAFEVDREIDAEERFVRDTEKATKNFPAQARFEEIKARVDQE